MDRDDIIRMAREAGAKPSHNPEEWDILKIRDTDLERFAALVAAHERERIIAANAPEIEKVNEYIKALEDSIATVIRARGEK
jgi:hypothetical protein